MRSRSRSLACLAGALAVLLLAGATARIWRVEKLSGEMPRGVYSSLQSPALSPDGNSVVYIADLAADEVYELFVSPSDGSGGTLRLNGSLVAGGDVSSFAISPDGTRIAYSADQLVDNRRELFSVPIDGSSAPVKLSGTVTTSGVNGFTCSPDGAWVAFLFGTGPRQLYLAPSDGSLPAVRLNGNLISGGNVVDFRFSPDSTRIVYLADQATDEVFELYSTTSAGPPVKLNPPLVSGGDVQRVGKGFEVSPDGARVVFLADDETNDVQEVHSVPIDGSAAAVELNSPLPSGGAVWSFAISTDGVRVVFAADQDVDNLVEIYTVPIAGGAVSQLNPANTGWITNFDLNPDDGRVVFDALVGGVRRLFSAPVDASSSAIVLDGSFTELNYISAMRFVPGAGRLVYTAVYLSTPQQIYSVPLDGSATPVVLDSAVASDFLIEPGTQTVFYRVAHGQYGTYELYSVPADGSAPAEPRSTPLEPTGSVESFNVAADSSRLVYSASRPLSGGNELLALAPQAPQAPVLVNDPLPSSSTSGRVTTFQFALGEARAVYLANQDYISQYQLYSVPVDGSQAPLLLSPGIDSVGDIRVTPDGTRLVFTLIDGGGSWWIYVVPADGSAPAALLGSTQTSTYRFDSIQISPDGTRVVYREWMDAGFPSGPIGVALWSAPIDASAAPVSLFDWGVGGSAITLDSDRVLFSYQKEVYSRPIDGSAPSVKLNGTLVAGGAVTSWWRTGDGLRVVYVADQLQDGLFELFSAPVDGSAAAIRLTSGGPLQVGEIVASPVGGEVVYFGTVGGVTQLYSVASDGSGPSVRLNTDLVPGGNASPSASISSDGTHVVYVADAVTDAAYELYSAVIGSSQSSVRISGPMIAAGDVVSGSEAISPDGQRVIYRADAETDGVYELFTAPITGGTAVRLHPALASGHLASFAGFEPDSAHVWFTLRAQFGTPSYLYRAPADGSRPPAEIQGPLVPGGSVESVLVGQDVTLFSADKETDNVIELFSVSHTLGTHAPDAGHVLRPAQRSY